MLILIRKTVISFQIFKVPNRISFNSNLKVHIQTNLLGQIWWKQESFQFKEEIKEDGIEYLLNMHIKHFS